MRFTLIDRITELQPGDSISAIKGLTLAEEYLQDHFPRFPVMPGVLMLEAMFQASAWLVYKTEDFAHSAVLLKEARNVRYGDFVQPGQSLIITAKYLKQDELTTTLKTEAMIGESVAVSARLVVERFNLVDRYPDRAATDLYTCRELRDIFRTLYRPATASSP
jgi:3-hydroxyacyl-[acyl-carrier-protein] dehydratase